jgi:hypothetical protein
MHFALGGSLAAWGVAGIMTAVMVALCALEAIRAPRGLVSAATTAH